MNVLSSTNSSARPPAMHCNSTWRWCLSVLAHRFLSSDFADAAAPCKFFFCWVYSFAWCPKVWGWNSSTFSFSFSSMDSKSLLLLVSVFKVLFIFLLTFSKLLVSYHLNSLTNSFLLLVCLLLDTRLHRRAYHRHTGRRVSGTSKSWNQTESRPQTPEQLWREFGIHRSNRSDSDQGRF